MDFAQMMNDTSRINKEKKKKLFLWYNLLRVADTSAPIARMLQLPFETL